MPRTPSHRREETPAQTLGKVLTNWRLRDQNRTYIVTQARLGALIGVDGTEYGKYELGKRIPPKHIFDAICEFYAGNKEAVDQLQAVYAQTSQVPAIDSYLASLARERPTMYASELELIHKSARNAYLRGEISVALDRLEHALQKARSIGTLTDPAFRIALTIANYRSQLGNHQSALDILNESRTLPDPAEEPRLFCSFQLSIAELHCRLFDKSGDRVVSSYASAIRQIQDVRSLSPLQNDIEWKIIEADALRSRILNLVSTMKPVNVELARLLFREFEHCVDRDDDYLSYLYDLTERRVRAASGTTDLSLLEMLRNPDPTRTIDALSAVIALFQQDQMPDAISAAKTWSTKLEQLGYRQKAWNFAQIELRLKQMVERREFLPSH